MVGLLGITIGLGFLHYGFVDLKKHRMAKAQTEEKKEEESANKAPKWKLICIVGMK